MKLVTLKEFRTISMISDSALIWLLEKQALPMKLDPEKGILLDLNDVNVQKLIEAMVAEKENIDSQQFNLLTEQAGRLIRENFDKILTDAVDQLKQSTR